MAVLVQLVDGVATQKFPIEDEPLRIGRAASNEVYVDDPLVSSRHAMIERDMKGLCTIRDLESTNGTFVNEKKIHSAILKHEDAVRCGLHSFKFLDEDSETTDKTQRIKKSWIPGVYYTKE